MLDEGEEQGKPQGTANQDPASVQAIEDLVEEQEQLATDQAEVDDLADEEQDQLATDQAEVDDLADEEQDQLATDQAEVDDLADEDQDQLATDQAEVDDLADEEQDQLATDQAEVDDLADEEQDQLATDQAEVDDLADEQQEEQADVVVTQARAAEGVIEDDKGLQEFSTADDLAHLTESPEQKQNKQEFEHSPASEGHWQDDNMAECMVEEETSLVEEMAENQQEVEDTPQHMEGTLQHDVEDVPPIDEEAPQCIDEEMPHDDDVDEQQDVDVDEQQDVDVDEQQDVDVDEQQDVDVDEQQDVDVDEQQDVDVDEHQDVDVDEQQDVDVKEQQDVDVEEQQDVDVKEQQDVDVEEQQDVDVNEQQDVDVDEQQDVDAEEQQDVDAEEQQDVDVDEQQDVDAEEQQDVDAEEQQDVDVDEQQDVDVDEQQDVDAEEQQDVDAEEQQDVDVDELQDVDEDESQGVDVDESQGVDVDESQGVDALEPECHEDGEAMEHEDTGLNVQEENTKPSHQLEDGELDSKEVNVNMDEQEKKTSLEEQEESEALLEENEVSTGAENVLVNQQDTSVIGSGTEGTPNTSENDTALIQEGESTTMDVSEAEPGEVLCAEEEVGTGDHEEQQEIQNGGKSHLGNEEEAAEHSENEELIDVESLDVDETGSVALDDQRQVEGSEQAETEEPPEESMEVEDGPETGVRPEDDIEGEVNGIEDEEELNDDELSPEGIVNGTVSDGKSLPQCRLKRNYCCAHCGINTQNPREHLYHLRDSHGERMKVFECPRCIYASKNQQKLIRHARMVHKLKIKRLESSSPSKRRSKSPRAKVSPVKSTRASVSPGRSTRSSPGKSPRSSESTFDTWDGMDDDDDDDEGEGENENENENEDDSQVDFSESPVKSDEKKSYYCEHCEFTCKSRKLLNSHETSYHLKRRFFRCVKCNYVTHLKGRYTKHMKYHQLPILKCDYCDFRTPYRWNLDRHLKNHTEDCGEFKCHLCNFTAQIKQSLTVHISNHHLTSEQIREREMRRTIGISDPADYTSDDQESELLRLERDEHPDALLLPGFDPPDSPSAPDGSQSQLTSNNSFRVSNIDMGSQDDSHMNAEDSKDEDGEPKRKKPKIKITLKKMKVKTPKTKDTFFQELNERHNFEEDFIHPDDVVHRHGNVYIKTFKCSFCTFKAAFKNEVSRHEKKIHSIPLPKYEVHTKRAKKSVKASKRASAASNDVLSQILQFPQTDYKNISDLKIADNPNKGKGAQDKESESKNDKASQEVKHTQEEGSRDASREASVEPPDDQLSDSKESPPSKDSSKKKGLSFFEKLQERMPTSNVQNLVCQFCGHESKCLSESVRHQKLHLSAKNIYAPTSLSTRCQFCRHRCKTTDDLMNHLKLCTEARKNQITDSGRRPSGGRPDENEELSTDDKKDILADTKDENIKDVDDKAEKLTNNSSQDKNDEKHPMENRVFVWNNFKAREGEQGTAKSKDSSTKEGKEKTNKRGSSEGSKKASGKNSGTKSPVPYDGPLDYIESPTPQGRHYYSKRVYRCPQCSFWATTASRFHVHIVGHFNRKPYNCSECGYKSNWRWDITKHIKLKTSRDSSHQDAQVIITDETGEKNYEKYDCYLAIIQLDETNAHRTEGGIPTRKGRPKRTPEKEEGQEPSTPSASPVRKPPMVSIPVMPRLQGLPRLTRAPGRGSSSRPGPMPFGPILPGPKMMVQIAGSGAASGTTPNSRPPPPLSLRGNPKSSSTPPAANGSSKASSAGDSDAGSPVTGSQYQIITPQGAVNTSLETLQLLASGSTNLSKLKKQQKGSIVEPEDKESQATLSHQMRLLVWLNLLAGGADEQVSVSSTGDDGREMAKMVLDHEGNPEWKCNSCDFRDSERETIVQHVRLAHARNGPVSLLHAVHRCDVCGYAAGTKRAVQLHIDTSHGGQGGITSRCEGQNPDTKDVAGESEGAEYNENARTFQCRLCPFTCKKRNEMRPHLIYHTARSDCIFKCMFCPYYVPTKGELFEHLSIHGMEVPPSVLDAAKNGSGSSTSSTTTTNSHINTFRDDVGARQFVCGTCPFETRSRAKLMHHRQFHKPKGLPFRCPHCSYNVTRRHLLSQHIRVHGMDDNIDGAGASDYTQLDDRSNSPSPSLTITPVGNATTEPGENSPLTDTSLLPKLTDETTMQMDDIPLVWVSRDNRFFKMFKCRHCPHVNLRKTNIQEHEKMHKTDASKVSGSLHCPNCSYVSVNAGVMSAHLKVHCGSMGQCHAVVDPSLSDEDQLRQLTSRASTPCSEVAQSLPAVKEGLSRKADEKVLYYCQQCPARFFLEKEIQIHTRFHTTGLQHTCDHCNYGVQQPAHLLAHLKVHTPEYQHRTRTMMNQHRTAATHPPVPGLTLPLDISMDVAEDSQSAQTTVRTGGQEYSASSQPKSNVPPQPPPTSKYMCDQCPASFSKLLTLQYHQSLHGAKNPHQCHRCSYAGKTSESLQQHVQLHTQHDENCQAEKAAKEVNTVKKAESLKTESVSKSKNSSKSSEKNSSSYYPPIKLKLIGLRPGASECGSDGSRPQFKYYVEEQVPLSGVDLLRRKTQLEKEGHDKVTVDTVTNVKGNAPSKSKASKDKEEIEEDDPKRIGDPKLHYPLHIDKLTGKSREKRYKCNKCPSAFEKTEQYHVHSNLHGSNHKYKCRICDYSVKFYANFMMHINRHKYHERMVSQNDGSSPPVESDLKYEPIISSSDNTSQGDKFKSRLDDLANKENLDDADLTTTERQHLLLQNKKGVTDPSKKDDDKDRRVFYCQYCPYANLRRDAVDSHSLRHHANGGYGVYKCTFCDYTASQPNFIREHIKVHFRPFKYVHPEGYMRHDRQEILSVPILPHGGRVNDASGNDESSTLAREKHLVFSHDAGVYKPLFVNNTEAEENLDSQLVSGIEVNFRSGDIVDAPSDFVISLRPGKGKGQFLMDTNNTFEHSDQIATNSAMPVAEKNCGNEVTVTIESKSFQNGIQESVERQSFQNDVTESIESQSLQDNATGMHVDIETMDTGDAPNMKETNLLPSNSSNLSDDTKMEVDSCEDAGKLQNGVVSIINGHVEGETQDLIGSEENMDDGVENKMEIDTKVIKADESLQHVTKGWGTDQPEKLLESH
nr:uncharacterized protein LOC123769175 isoform X3 [Procambarus clarkii]